MLSILEKYTNNPKIVENLKSLWELNEKVGEKFKEKQRNKSDI